jgi:DNA-binding beta-propeller fold protein YncE
MNPSTRPIVSSRDVCVGAGEFGYRVEIGWGQLPSGWSFVEAPGVATDSAGNVFVFNRGEHPVIVFDRDGRFLRSWGEGIFKRPHGVTIGPDDAVYLCDDCDHTVHKFTTDGKRLWTLGTSGRASDTGATTVDYRTIQRAAGPFNFPTNLAISPQGDLYVADGYGNARVHRFSADGKLLASWGEPGDGPGQFHLPHGIAVDRQGIVYVADRENSRLQRFTADGQFIDQWTNVARPCQVTIDRDHVFVAELGYRAGMFPGSVAPRGAVTGGRLSVFDGNGVLQARWGGGDNPCQPGDFFAPHDVCLDTSGNLYVGEVTMSAGGNLGMVPPDCHCLQKFVRLDTSDQP